MSVEIAALKPEQAPAFAEMLSDLMAEGMGFPEEALRQYRSLWTVDAIRGQAEDPRRVLLAAWEDGKMAGLLLGTPPEGGVATIIWVLVSPDCRKKGIGGRLFGEACARYRDMGAHKIKLTVPERDTVRFYEKLGMKLEGTHPNHWWNMDFWSMGKDL